MSAFNVETCQAITALLAGKTFERAELDGDVLVLRCDGVSARVALSAAVTSEGEERVLVRLPAPLVDLLEEAVAEAAEKPPAQRVAIGGIDATRVGFSQSATGINWRTVAALPAFQEFVRSQGFAAMPNLQDDEWAARFILSRAEAGQDEAEFFNDYARWFEASGRWPDELPTGGLKQ